MRKLAAVVGVFGVVAGTAVLAENNSSLAPLVQETPIVLAQVGVPAGDSPQPNFILETCKQTESTGDPRSAFRAVDPAYMLKNYLYASSGGSVIADLTSIKNITLLQGATHGKITSVIDNTGRSWYRYDPIPNYTGNDQAIFLAEFEGKRYKIVVKLVVSPTVGESPLGEGEEPVCPPPELIKVANPH